MASDPVTESGPTRSLKWLSDNRYRLLKFAGVGLSGVGVNLVVFVAFFHVVLASLMGGDLRFVTANAAGFVVSVFTNFMLNDLWTWGDRRKGRWSDWLHRLGKYYVTASGAGAVQLFTAWASLRMVWEPLGPALFGHEFAPLLGVLTGIACGMIINFTASHLWAFRDVPISPR